MARGLLLSQVMVTTSTAGRPEGARSKVAYQSDSGHFSPCTGRLMEAWRVPKFHPPTTRLTCGTECATQYL